MLVLCKFIHMDSLVTLFTLAILSNGLGSAFKFLMLRFRPTLQLSMNPMCSIITSIAKETVLSLHPADMKFQ